MDHVEGGGRGNGGREQRSVDLIIVDLMLCPMIILSSAIIYHLYKNHNSNCPTVVTFRGTVQFLELARQYLLWISL